MMRTTIKARPASPPTTPPTRVGVDGALPPPDPTAAAVDEDGFSPPVPVGVPPPPATPGSVDVLDALAEDDGISEVVAEDEKDEVVDKAVLLFANVELLVV